MKSKQQAINVAAWSAAFAVVLCAAQLAACTPPQDADLIALQDAERGGIVYSKAISLKVEAVARSRDVDLAPLLAVLRETGFNSVERSTTQSTKEPNYRAVVQGSRVGTISASEIQSLLATLRRQLPAPITFTWTVSQSAKT